MPEKMSLRKRLLNLVKPKVSEVTEPVRQFSIETNAIRMTGSFINDSDKSFYRALSSIICSDRRDHDDRRQISLIHRAEPTVHRESPLNSRFENPDIRAIHETMTSNVYEATPARAPEIVPVQPLAPRSDLRQYV